MQSIPCMKIQIFVQFSFPTERKVQNELSIEHSSFNLSKDDAQTSLQLTLTSTCICIPDGICYVTAQVWSGCSFSIFFV